MMKKITIITIYILLTNFMFGQSLNHLDVKNGFKHFKFGSSPKQIKDIEKVTNQFSQNPDVVEYYYTGKEINYISDVNIYRIKLSFYKNKLFSILVSFGDFDDDFDEIEYNSVLYSLERLYGKNWNNPTNKDGKIINGAIWCGKVVNLELFRIDYSKSKSEPYDYGFISGYMSIENKDISKQLILEEF